MSRDQEWPEFRRWYELTMEEQRIYAEEDECDHDRLLDAVDAERDPLGRAMLSRTPQNLKQLAELAVIELRYADKRDDANIPWIGSLSWSDPRTGRRSDRRRSKIGSGAESSAGRRFAWGG